jgi:FAD/FMN-containing dehydrogenase
MTTTTTRFRALGDALRGGLIMPGDDGYDHARELFYGGMDRRPAAVARVADAADVARAVTFARETGTPLSVRGGGHSGAGHSVIDDALTIDLADLRSLEIDAGERLAWAHAGLTAGEYTMATAEHGLATGFGDSGSVGVGGITLGGGVGFLARAHGLTIDSLIAAEVVTADGEVLHVDDEQHPDLFWAIRGGGGNFGVVTRLRLRLHDVGTVVGGLLFLPATPETITAFVAEAQAAPDELTTIANVMPAPPMPFLPEEFHGSLVIFAMLTCVGDVEAGERAIAPFRSIAPPIADMVRPMTYPEMYMPEEDGSHPIGVVRSLFVDSLGLAEAGTIVEQLEASTAMMRVAQIRVLGGAVSGVANDATAYAHRDRPIMVNTAALYEQAEDEAVHQAWVRGFASALAGGDLRAYVNFLVDEGPERVRQAYPAATWERLRSIKARYDPTNLFRHNQNIPPAS